MIFNDEEDEKKKAAQKPDALAEKFLKTRQILLSGEINKELAQAVNKQLLLLEADGRYMFTSTRLAATSARASRFLT